jgi:hypothetical protein
LETADVVDDYAPGARQPDERPLHFYARQVYASPEVRANAETDSSRSSREVPVLPIEAAVPHSPSRDAAVGSLDGR